MIDHLNPAPEEEVAGEDGLGQDGDPEGEVIEEGDSSEAEVAGARPRVLKAPGAPTQKEIDEHMATHLPHAAWCDICMKGRGRNTPHRKGAQRWARRARDGEPEGESEAEDSQEENPHSGPVPRVSMDYFYLSKKETSEKKGAKAMSTKELQRKLRDLGKSDKGSRPELVQRYERYAPQEEREERGSSSASALDPRDASSDRRGAHASEHPTMVMVDEATGNRYMRAVEHKGLGGDGDASWLVKDMHQELKAWGYPGGAQNELIMKSDGEPAIVAVREALARCHGGRVTPEQPPKG